MPISKSTYSNCAVLHVFTKCKKFSEMYVHNAGIAEMIEINYLYDKIHRLTVLHN